MLRISEVLGLKWKNILWDRGIIAIRQTFVHLNIQDGAKTKLSWLSGKWRSSVPR
jgi:integrase